MAWTQPVPLTGTTTIGRIAHTASCCSTQPVPLTGTTTADMREPQRINLTQPVPLTGTTTASSSKERSTIQDATRTPHGDYNRTGGGSVPRLPADATRTPHGDYNRTGGGSVPRLPADATRTPHGDYNSPAAVRPRPPDRRNPYPSRGLQLAGRLPRDDDERDATRTPHGDYNASPAFMMPTWTCVDATRTPHGDYNRTIYNAGNRLRRRNPYPSRGLQHIGMMGNPE